VPPRELEDVTVAALRERGLLRPSKRIRSLAAAAWLTAVAAALVAFVSWSVLRPTGPGTPSAPAGPRYVLLPLRWHRPDRRRAPDTRRREYPEWARDVVSGAESPSGEERRKRRARSTRPHARPRPHGPAAARIFSSAHRPAPAQRIASTCPPAVWRAITVEADRTVMVSCPGCRKGIAEQSRRGNFARLRRDAADSRMVELVRALASGKLRGPHRRHRVDGTAFSPPRPRRPGSFTT
jgi:hypothetical protein